MFYEYIKQQLFQLDDSNSFDVKNIFSSSYENIRDVTVDKKIYAYDNASYVGFSNIG